MVVTIEIFKSSSSKLLGNRSKRIGEKTFSVDPNPKSKSMGYMVGYIQALEENGLETVVTKQFKGNSHMDGDKLVLDDEGNIAERES